MKNIDIVQNIGPNELYPIYGIVKKPFWQTATFYFLICAILFLFLVFIVFKIVKKIKSRVRKLESHELAIIGLNELKSALELNKIDCKNFYLRLTQILKKYFFDKFGYAVMGLTDFELIKFLENINFDNSLLENIRSMRESQEVVKFANAKAGIDLMERDLAFCKSLVLMFIEKK